MDKSQGLLQLLADTCIVNFWILVKNSLFLSPGVNKNMPLAQLFQHLNAYPQGPQQILASVMINDCKLYQINPAISARWKFSDIVKACFAADWMQVDQTEWIEDLVEDEKYLTSGYVCLVIEPPQDENLQPTTAVLIEIFESQAGESC